jgi:hypothetical protein
MTLLVKRSGALHMLGRVRGVRGGQALRLGHLRARARARLVRAVGVLALLVLLTQGLTRLVPVPLGNQPIPTMHDPLGVRVRYERALLVDAEYQLDLKPRVVTLWLWRIGVLPRQPDAQEAFADVRGIEAVALDQPDMLADLWRLRLAYQRLERTVRRDQQAPPAGQPDYTPLQAWLDTIDAEFGASASVSVPDGVPGGPGQGTAPQYVDGN